MEQYMRLALGIAGFAGAGFVIYLFTNRYLAASGDRMSRVIVAFEGSTTLLWARFSVVVGLLVTGLVNAADYFNLPGVSSVLSEFLTPTTVSLMMAGIAIITELARRRNM